MSGVASGCNRPKADSDPNKSVPFSWMFAFYFSCIPLPRLLSTAAHDVRVTSHHLMVGHLVLRYFMQA